MQMIVGYVANESTKTHSAVKLKRQFSIVCKTSQKQQCRKSRAQNLRSIFVHQKIWYEKS